MKRKEKRSSSEFLASDQINGGEDAGSIQKSVYGHQWRGLFMIKQNVLTAIFLEYVHIQHGKGLNVNPY